MSQNSEIQNLTIESAGKLLRDKKITVRQLVYAYLERAKSINEKYNIFLGFYDEHSNFDEQIDRAQKMIDENSATKITGIPMAIKDNILIEGQIASAASKILENYRATYTATAAQKLIDAGAIFIGRVNMDEFAMGGSTENSAFGPTKNAIDDTRVAGGSSGGSAVAVAIDSVIASIGSDTGGSIRQPASFNGVVGLKPTYGSVSRHGLMAMASSLDVIGPITKTTNDAEIIFDIIKGRDPFDSTSVSDDVSFTQNYNSKKNDQEYPDQKTIKKIGVPKKYLQKGIDDEVAENFESSIKLLQNSDFEIVDIDLPNLEYALAVYYTLMPAEVSANMARYDGIKYGERKSLPDEKLISDYFKTRGNFLGAEVKRRIILGTYVLSAGYSDQYYNKAWQVRNLIRKDFEKAFEKVDIIAMPTSPTPAFKIGERSNDPLKMYLADIFTVFANLVGVPAISIPSGYVLKEEKELPVGIQFIAPQLKEQILFQISQKFEKIK